MFREVCGFLRVSRTPNQSTKCQKRKPDQQHRRPYSGKSSLYHVSGFKFKTQKPVYLKNFWSQPFLFKLFDYQDQISQGLNRNRQSNDDLHSSTKIYPEMTKQRCKLLLQKFNVSYSLHLFHSFDLKSLLDLDIQTIFIIETFSSVYYFFILHQPKD